MADTIDLKLPSLERLQSAEQMELLDVVDSLRAVGLSEIVALPQLIVCGDQSSGKSSVLEAISGIPFPRQENLCTRFATEVILRRAPRDTISVSIVPGKDRTGADRDRLLKFRHNLTSKKDFKELFEIARDAMGLSATEKSFSNDALRVEFCGPSQPQLTLVDLPGLIHSELGTQARGDVKLVHDLVSQYLKNPRSIILAVVSAKNDISNQAILNRAQEVDPQGVRTLGIITKPDTLVGGSKSEEAFIRLARNEEVKLSSLGWHVVKNIDSVLQSSQDDSRDREETRFFQESRFNCLPAHTVGIYFLRARLSKVLFTQIRQELPRLVDDIESQISSAKAAKDKLGPSRAQFDEQRLFLISLSQSFQSICRDAVRGDYEHEFFRDDLNPERRLCASVMNMHFDFANNVRKNGAFWLVDDENIKSDRYRSREQAIREACDLLKKSRGRELPGLPNPLLVGELFRLYSQPWEHLARLHIKKVWEATNRFFELLLRYLTDDDVCENLLRLWVYPIMEKRLDCAYVKLDELLEVHKDYPLTTNGRFVSSSRALRQTNQKAQFEDAVKQAQRDSGQKVSIEEISRLFSTMSTKEDMDMDMVAAEEAFDNMNAFYEVALNLFTDNVPTLTIQGPLIREVPKILCPTAVFSMEPDILKRIAGETDEKVTERESTVKRLETLESGARICRQYAKRPQSIPDKIPEEVEVSELSVLIRPTTKRGGNAAMKRSDQSSVRSVLESTSINKPTPNLFGHLLAPNEEKDLEPRNSETASRSKMENPFQSSKGLFSNISVNETPGASGTLFAGLGRPVPENDCSKQLPGTAASSKNRSQSEGENVSETKATTTLTLSPFNLGGGGSDAASGSKSSTMSRESSPAPGKQGKGLNFPPSSTNISMDRPPTTVGAILWPFIQKEPGTSVNAMNNFQHICFNAKYEGFSCEELRLEDYRLGHRPFPRVDQGGGRPVNHINGFWPLPALDKVSTEKRVTK